MKFCSAYEKQIPQPLQALVTKYFPGAFSWSLTSIVGMPLSSAEKSKTLVASQLDKECATEITYWTYR